MKNESAFPSSKIVGDISDPTGGMTLRDYFAAKALPSAYNAYTAYADQHGWDEDWRDGVASDAYQMADAMLAERERDND